MRTRRRHKHVTALHEAGHTVAVVHTGGVLKKASIIADGDYLGCVWHTPATIVNGQYDPDNSARQLKWRRLVENQLLIGLCGAAAQREAGSTRYLHAHCLSDYQSVADCALALTNGLDGPVADTLVAHFEARAAAFTRERWKEIEAVAECLLEHGTIGAQQVRAAIDAVYGLRPFGTQASR